MESPPGFDGVDLVLSIQATLSFKSGLRKGQLSAVPLLSIIQSYWRMHDDVPLVVPEVNEAALQTHQGIANQIAQPFDGGGLAHSPSLWSRTGDCVNVSSRLWGSPIDWDELVVQTTT